MHPDIGVVFSRRLLNRPIEDVPDLEQSVIAGTEQL
jgi:hypothetical protein